MPRWIYLNGAYCRPDHAKVSFEDRGFQFGDSVYAVLVYHQGHFVDGAAHLEAFRSYAHAIGYDLPLSTPSLWAVMKECLRRNRLDMAQIYLQSSRGEAPRVHWFPAYAHPSLCIVAKPWASPLDPPLFKGVKATTARDIRWAHPSIKTNAMIANVLLRERAKQSGASDVWLYDDKGMITEGASANGFMVTNKGHLVTRQKDGTFLSGVTRKRLLALAHGLGLVVEERAFSKEELFTASEAFFTGAASLIKPVTSIDHQPVGDGEIGPITRCLAEAYDHYIKTGDMS